MYIQAMYRSLATERLIIQPLEMEDHVFIRRLLNTDGWLQYIGNRNIGNESDAKAYIAQKLADESYYCSTFRLKETQEPVGIITFIYRSTQDFPDIGYAMLPEFEKKGYAYEAVKKYLDTIVAEKITDKVIAITLSSNNKSIHLLQRLGLQREKDFIEDKTQMSLFSVASEDYRIRTPHG